jgi:hypothetical protein
VAAVNLPTAIERRSALFAEYRSRVDRLELTLSVTEY